jgi:hypothetical protein
MFDLIFKCAAEKSDAAGLFSLRISRALGMDYVRAPAVKVEVDTER